MALSRITKITKKIGDEHQRELLSVHLDAKRKTRSDEKRLTSMSTSFANALRDWKIAMISGA